MHHLPPTPGGIRTTTLTLAGRAMHLVVPREPNAILERCAAGDGEERMPYWAEIWPSARGLAEVVLAGPALGGVRCLDLGCGLGVAGIAAGCRGAQVVFGDIDPDAVAFARHNAQLNGVAEAEAVVMDWARPPLPPANLDLVVAADVIYEQPQLEQVVRFLVRHLRPDGRALLAEPNRSVARGYDRLLSEAGFDAREQRIAVAEAGGEVPISIWEIRWRPR